MASYVPTLCLTGFNTKKIDVGNDAFKVALGTGTVPTANRDSANEYYAGSDFTEFTGGSGYSAGGLAITLTGAQYTSGGVHNYCVAQSAVGYIQWAAATITSVTYAYLYDTTSVIKYAIGVWDFGGPQTVTANTFQIAFSGVGAAGPSYTVWYWSLT